MKRKIIKTADGSTTIHLEDWNEQYHSIHGAIQEAYHVFIKYGLKPAIEYFGKSISIQEIGFGTGLNAIITYLEAKKHLLQIQYEGIEAYPVAIEEIQQLNYIELLKADAEAKVFKKMHVSTWEETVAISSFFSLKKRQEFFDQLSDKEAFHLIYFDAFGARVQPELWTVSIFQKMYNALVENGILVTYSAKGSVRRAMQEVGFTVERMPGPPGKREMLRAIKLIKN